MKIDILYKEGDDLNRINSEIKLINQILNIYQIIKMEYQEVLYLMKIQKK